MRSLISRVRLRLAGSLTSVEKVRLGIHQAAPNNLLSMKYFKLLTTSALALCATVSLPSSGRAASAAEISQSAKAALRSLYANNPTAELVGKRAKAVLVFPSIIKGGFIVGAQHGDGALLSGGRTLGYYNTVAASYGLQAGVQKFSYAMFFMNDASLAYLRKSGGWEVGSAPSLVVVDTGMARSLSTSTLQKGIYVFFFNQKGLMGGLGLQGTKITRYTPSA
jgi:lipid-binding SYLF domain-containing protein